MANALRSKKWILFWFPVLLFLFNCLSKLAFATYEDIGLDEPFSIYHAQFEFGTIIEQLKRSNSPPLFELVLHVWIKLFGISPLAVRMLPLLFASLAPVALYYFGKRFFSMEVAIVSSSLLSLSDLLFYYSHDCRAYSLFLLLSILSMHFFLKMLSEEKVKARSLILFVLFTLSLIYTHYFGIYIVFFQAIHLLLFHRGKLIKFFVYYLAILLLYLPQLYYLLTRTGDSVKHGTWLSPPSGLESLYNMLWVFCNFPFITVGSIGILVFSLVKLIKKKDIIRPAANTTLVLTWFLFPYLGIFVISYWVPMYISRYLIFALPAFYLVLVICIQYLVRINYLRYLVFLAFVLSFGFTIDLTNDKKERMSEAVKMINSKKDPATLVIMCTHYYVPAFAYYYKRDHFSAVSDNREYHLMDSLLRSDNIYTELSFPNLKAIDRSRYARVIYYGIGNEYNDPKNPTLQYLSAQYRLTEIKKVQASGQLYFFEKFN